MARVFNQNRIVNAKLGAVDITSLGKTFAIQYGLDGMSVVDVTVQAPPTDIKEFLEGNTLRTQYAVASDVDNLVDYVFSAFPNLEEIYLFNTDGVTLGSNAFTGLSELEHIYVPEDLLNDYKTNYPQWASLFTGIVQDYTLTIPHIEGESTTLTTQYVNQIIAMLSEGQKASITKVVIDSAFTSESADEIAWGYNWVNALPICNNNIWYGSTQYDFTSYTIKGSGTLTSAIVENTINNVSSDKLTLITKLVISNNITGYQRNSLNSLTQLLSLEELEMPMGDMYTYKSVDYEYFTNQGAYYQRRLTFYTWFEYFNNDNFIKKLTLVNNGGESIIAFDISAPRIGNINIEELFIKSSSSNITGLWFEHMQEISNVKKINIDKDINFGSPRYCFSDNFNLDEVKFRSSDTNEYGLFNGVGTNTTNGVKIWFLRNSVYTTGSLDYFYQFYTAPKIDKIYFPAEDLITALTTMNTSYTYQNKYVGFLDYTDTVPTFSGYTDQWYSDEDCTIPISTTDFVSGNRYYVKLTVI